MFAWRMARGFGARGSRWFLLAAIGFSVCLHAQTVSVDAGAGVQTGDALIDLDCAALNVGGSLDLQSARIVGVSHLVNSGQITAASATLEVGGDWRNQGSFAAGSSTVRLGDRCDHAQSSITGDSNFSTLRIESARGKAYRFDASFIQAVTQTLVLGGVPGQRLSLGSTQFGSRAALALNEGGAQQISWVSVADMSAPVGSAWLARGAPELFNSVDAGNNFRWFLGELPDVPPVPLPVDSLWMLMLVALAMVLLGARRFGFRR